jgi:hypothetical protein
MDDKRDNAYQSWTKLLDPEQLKANLIRASIYLSSYELLKSAVVRNPRGFFNMGHPVPGEDSPEYKAEVVALHPRDRFHASCLWFKKMDAIDDSDVTTIEEIRTHRNDIAHELPKYLGDSRFQVNMQLLDSIHFMLSKVERWWIREIEMGVDYQHDNVDIDAIPNKEIKSGTMVMMELIHKITHGQEDELKQWLEVFRQVWDSDQGGPKDEIQPTK